MAVATPSTAHRDGRASAGGRVAALPSEAVPAPSFGGLEPGEVGVVDGLSKIAI